MAPYEWLCCSVYSASVNSKEANVPDLPLEWHPKEPPFVLLQKQHKGDVVYL